MHDEISYYYEDGSSCCFNGSSSKKNFIRRNVSHKNSPNSFYSREKIYSFILDYFPPSFSLSLQRDGGSITLPELPFQLFLFNFSFHSLKERRGHRVRIMGRFLELARRSSQAAAEKYADGLQNVRLAILQPERVSSSPLKPRFLHVSTDVFFFRLLSIALNRSKRTAPPKVKGKIKGKKKVKQRIKICTRGRQRPNSMLSSTPFTLQRSTQAFHPL